MSEKRNAEAYAQSEAAIWEEGTLLTGGELYAAWQNACHLAGEYVDPQTVYEETLRNHPRFEPSWLD